MEDLLEELSGPPLNDFYKRVFLTAALRHCRLALSIRTLRSAMARQACPSMIFIQALQRAR